MFQTPGQAPLRGASTTDKPFGFYDATDRRRLAGAGRALRQHAPRTTRDASTGGARACSAGARITGAAISLRNGPYDFKPQRARRARIRLAALLRGRRAVLRQGRDADRRLWRERRTGEHAELAAGLPAAAAEAARQRSARRAASRQARHSGGRRAPRRAHAGARPSEHCRRNCIRAIRMHRRSSPSHMQGRAACFWATPAARGCSIRANYQSTTVHLPPALATGKLDILVNAMVREVTLGQGRPRAAASASSTGRQASASDATARAVVSCRERLRNRADPAQLEVGATSRRDWPTRAARLGRYLMDTVGSAGGWPDSAAREPSAAQ